MSKANRANEMSEKMSDINLELNEITKIKEYFNNEIKERKDIINKINKYIVAFDHADKVFITLSASFGTLSIASHATLVGTLPSRYSSCWNRRSFVNFDIYWLLLVIKRYEKKEKET